MRKTIPIAAACAALSLVSCEVLFPSVVIDDAGSGVDGGATSRDSSTTDGGDATTSTGDSAVGASDAAIDGALWCDMHPGHTYCFDFDNVGSAVTGWSLPNIGAGNDAALDPTTYVSPPYSMQSSVYSDSPIATYAVLVENMPLNVSQLVIAADVRPTSSQDGTYNNAGLLGANFVNDAGGYYSVSVGLSASGPSLGIVWPTDDAGDYTSMSESFESLNADDAGWTHIEATIVFGPPLAITLTFNNQTEWNQPFIGTVAIGDLSGAGVFVGIVAVGDGGPLAVNFDNVTIDVQSPEAGQ